MAKESFVPSVNTSEENWQRKVAELMKKRKKFKIVSVDNVGIETAAFSLGTHQNPTRSIPLDDGDKLFIAGAGAMMLFGAGMILLAFFDSEPTTKLGLLVGGGIAAVLGGGLVILAILLTRKKYQWTLEYDAETGKFVVEAKPCK